MNDWHAKLIDDFVEQNLPEEDRSLVAFNWRKDDNFLRNCSSGWQQTSERDSDFDCLVRLSNIGLIAIRLVEANSGNVIECQGSGWIDKLPNVARIPKEFRLTDRGEAIRELLIENPNWSSSPRVKFAPPIISDVSHLVDYSVEITPNAELAKAPIGDKTGDNSRKFSPFVSCLTHDEPEIQKVAAHINQEQPVYRIPLVIKAFLDGLRPVPVDIDDCKTMLNTMRTYERRQRNIGDNNGDI